MCEAFSYEPKTQTCLLTDTSQTYSSLARKITSLYYRRRFSSSELRIKLGITVVRDFYFGNLTGWRPRIGLQMSLKTESVHIQNSHDLSFFSV